MSAQPLNGKTAVVTGGSRGIGRAVANSLARDGANLMICARGRDRLTETAESIEDEYGVECRTFSADLIEASAGSSLVDAAVDAYDQIDILINNVGDAPAGTFENLTDDEWRQAIDLKLLGYIRCTRAALPYLVETGGAIVNVVGIAGVKPTPSAVASSVVNGALLNLTDALASQYSPRGVRVNAVNPGPVATDRWDGIMERLSEEAGLSVEKVRERTEELLPLGRICSPEEVADVVAFLASEEASFVNGTAVDIDGAQQVTLPEFGEE